MRIQLPSLALAALLASSALSGCQAPEFAPIQYHDGFAAQPFSAADIRAAHPAGSYTLYRIQEGDSPAILRRTTWVEVNEVGCKMTNEMMLEDGTPVGQRTEGADEWQSLRDHAKWPEIAVNFSEQTWQGPEGPFQAWVYEAIGKEDGQRVVETFVFDILSPGSPVEWTRQVGDEVVFTMALVESNRLKRG